MQTQRFQKLVSQGAAWLELTIDRESDPVGHGLLGVRAFDRFHREVAMRKSTLLDLLFESDIEQMASEAADLMNVLAPDHLTTGLHAYVLDNRLFFQIGRYADDDPSEVTYDADLPDFLSFLSMSAGKVRAAAATWTQLSRKAQLGLLSNPETPAEVMRVVAEAGDEEAARLVALHHNVDGATLHLLAGHDSLAVQSAVAKHPATGAAALTTLAEGLDARDLFKRLLLGQAIARHPNTAAETLRFLYERHRGLLAQSLALNPNLPSELLTELARSSSADVRVKVALNECAPVGVLRTLASDEDERVRTMAAHTLEQLAPFIGSVE